METSPQMSKETEMGKTGRKDGAPLGDEPPSVTFEKAKRQEARGQVDKR